jgi:hypothetical protein
VAVGATVPQCAIALFRSVYYERLTVGDTVHLGNLIDATIAVELQPDQLRRYRVLPRYSRMLWSTSSIVIAGAQPVAIRL